MSKWIEVVKQGDGVIVSDGTTLEVGREVPMGLGFIQLRNTKKAGLHIVRFSKSGRFKYALRLTHDGRYRLGPSFAHRVIPAADEVDPIKRILRKMDIPVSILVNETRPIIEVEERWYDNGQCPNGRPTYRYVTDGTKTLERSVTLEKPHGYFRGGGYTVNNIEGASYAIRIDSGRSMNGATWHQPARIVVWPHCEPTTLANALAPIVFGEGANEEFLEALKDLDAASKWIEKNLSITTHPQWGNVVIVNGNEFEVDYNYLQEPQVLSHLIKSHGTLVIEEYLSDIQRHFLRAKQSVEEAVEYVTGNYRLVAVKCGDKKHIKFALKSSPESLGDFDSIHLRNDGKVELPLRRLFGIYENLLREMLFERASGRIELVPSYPRFPTFERKDGWWVAGQYSDHQGWQMLQLVKEEDAILVRLGEGEFSSQLLKLSGEERYIGAKKMGGFHAVMCDGDEAYIDSFLALLPVKVGETRNFVFRVSNEWSNPDKGASIWGITVSRTEDGVTYTPYDNHLSYTCEGYWGGEVSSKKV